MLFGIRPSENENARVPNNKHGKPTASNMSDNIIEYSIANETKEDTIISIPKNIM